jgi:hypothetical protein
MEYKCKCEKLFCISHLQAEEHNCTFDYKKEGEANLKRQMEVGSLYDKINRI